LNSQHVMLKRQSLLSPVGFPSRRFTGKLAIAGPKMRQNGRLLSKIVLVKGRRVDKIALLPPGRPEKMAAIRCAQRAMTGAKAE
jgi:hypothetical protein